MKILKTLTGFSLAVAATLTAFSASAAPYQVSYDTDGIKRTSHYLSGPVNRIVTASDSAYEFRFYIFSPANADGVCENARIVDIASQEVLAYAPVTNADIKGSTRRTAMTLSEGFEQNNKQLELSCVTRDGSMIDVHHKIPGAPSINWNVNIEAAGEYVAAPACGRAHCGGNFGKFEALRASGSLMINNHTEEGFCGIVEDRDVSLGMFHGKDSRSNFHTDYFWVNKTFSDYTPPIIFQRLVCSNPGGVTTAIKVWDVSSEDIHLMSDESFFQ